MHRNRIPQFARFETVTRRLWLGCRRRDSFNRTPATVPFWGQWECLESIHSGWTGSVPFAIQTGNTGFGLPAPAIVRVHVGEGLHGPPLSSRRQTNKPAWEARQVYERAFTSLPFPSRWQISERGGTTSSTRRLARPSNFRVSGDDSPERERRKGAPPQGAGIRSLCT